MLKALPIISSYLVVVSMLYLMGYWGEFNINFSEYITISEVTIIALKALISSSAASSIGILLSQIYLRDIFFPSGGGLKTPEGKFLNKWWKWLYVPFLIILLYAYYIDHPLKMSMSALVFSPVLGVWLGNQGLLSNFNLDKNLRFYIVFLAVQIAFFANPTGSINAKKIRNSKTDNQVLVDGKQYSYIGKLGNSIFLYLKQEGKVVQINPIPKYMEYIPNKSLNPTG